MEKKKMPPLPPVKPEMKTPPITEPPQMPEMYAPSHPKHEMDVPMESTDCPSHHPMMSMPSKQKMIPHHSPHMDKANYHLMKKCYYEKKCDQYKYYHKQKYRYYMKKKMYHQMKYELYMKNFAHYGYHPSGIYCGHVHPSCSCQS